MLRNHWSRGTVNKTGRNNNSHPYAKQLEPRLHRLKVFALVFVCFRAES